MFLVKFCSGTAPIRIETGRFEKLPLDQRLCPFCDNTIENELHVILKCHVYNELREPLLDFAAKIEPNLGNYSEENVLYFILSNELLCKFTAKTLHAVLDKRKSIVYMR